MYNVFHPVELLKRRESIVQRWRTGEKNFTPFVLSVDGLLQREASHFVKCLSANLASRWEKPFSDVLTLTIVCFGALCQHVFEGI